MLVPKDNRVGDYGYVQLTGFVLVIVVRLQVEDYYVYLLHFKLHDLVGVNRKKDESEHEDGTKQMVNCNRSNVKVHAILDGNLLLWLYV